MTKNLAEMYTQGNLRQVQENFYFKKNCSQMHEDCCHAKVNYTHSDSGCQTICVKRSTHNFQRKEV